MTELQIAKKLQKLERQIIELRQYINLPYTMGDRGIWQRTKGSITAKRAQAMLKSVQRSRRSADRQRI